MTIGDIIADAIERLAKRYEEKKKNESKNRS